MSLWPFLFPLLGDIESLNRMYKHDFGVSVTPYFYEYPSAFYKLRQDYEKKLQNARSLVGKEGFQVNLNVRQFKPNELSVKTIDDHVVVEGKHEEREDDHGYVARQFLRRYKLPKGYDPDKVASTLSSDGILTVKVPPPPKPLGNHNARVVDIQQTGPAHLSINDNPEVEEEPPELLEREKKIGGRKIDEDSFKDQTPEPDGDDLKDDVQVKQMNQG